MTNKLSKNISICFAIWMAQIKRSTIMLVTSTTFDGAIIYDVVIARPLGADNRNLCLASAFVTIPPTIGVASRSRVDALDSGISNDKGNFVQMNEVWLCLEKKMYGLLF